MKITIEDKLIPGTILSREEMGGITGAAFIRQIFLATDGVMLTRIREISGVDGSTLQNWTKRGWVSLSQLKKYNENQVARILIINMLRSCMQLDRILFLIRYVNKTPEEYDDIITDLGLYDYICRVINRVDALDEVNDDVIKRVIDEETSDYTLDKFNKIADDPEAKERLCTALDIICDAYFSSLAKRASDEKIAELAENNPWVEEYVAMI